MTDNQLRPVYVVDGARTPFLKTDHLPGPFAASDLAVMAGRALLARMPFAPEQLDEAVIGCVMPAASEVNIARVISLRLGCGKKVPAYTVARNCASGMQALDCAAKDIALGRAEMVLAGGAEAMSHYPLMFDLPMQAWSIEIASAKTLGKRLAALAKFRPRFLKPVIGILQGLTDHTIGLSMGQTAENLAYRFGISREEMDAFAMESHRRLGEATDAGRLEEKETLIGPDGTVYAEDSGLRRDTSMEKLAKLKPVFDPKVGLVTAGNSAQITDGAAIMVLASAQAVDKYNLPVLGRIVDIRWAGVNPAEMGLGPVHAMASVMKENGLSSSDVDFWEVNEAFAVQVLACLKAWEDPLYMKEEVEVDGPFGPIDRSKLNVDGGAVGLGHPVGASGARITLHLLNVLKRNNSRRGIASLCIGGGQGGAILVERAQ
ncbi:MAG: acetyl-CoA C-acetyltransferase [Nitrospinae bacterium]|nr:acetyl-CoA C-acetyltransferase [Nitrospinota bacterium]